MSLHNLIATLQNLKPHLKRTCKLSNDPQFKAKFRDVIGLYLDSPEKFLVLCGDKKTQCEALEHTQPSLPLGRGNIRSETHDHIWRGTITLFATQNYYCWNSDCFVRFGSHCSRRGAGPFLTHIRGRTGKHCKPETAIALPRKHFWY